MKRKQSTFSIFDDRSFMEMVGIQVDEFKFSIVVAVYNVEQWLDEAISSLIKQTIGFENVQVILVDDGSTDQSGLCCEKWKMAYPNNVIVIHKENGGVSSARNIGMEKATGRYINFMDPDDMISYDTLENVYSFFSAHENEIDVVSIPIFFFDAYTGEHWQNQKFSNGSRVIDLNKEYNVIQSSVSSAFYKREVMSIEPFDERLKIGEDYKKNILILQYKKKLGVVSEGKYYYRKRPKGDSAINKQYFNVSWYTDTIEYFYKEIIDIMQRENETVFLWVQYALLCDIQWRISEDYFFQMRQILSEEQQKKYMINLYSVLQYIDNKVIIDAGNEILSLPVKAFILHMKQPDILIEKKIFNNDLTINFSNYEIDRVSNSKVEICFLEEKEGIVFIDGIIWCLPNVIDSNMSILFRIGMNFQKGDLSFCPPKTMYRFGEALYEAWIFHEKVPLIEDQVQDLQIAIQSIDNLIIPIRELYFGQFLPISIYTSEMALTKSWKYIMTPSYIRFIPYYGIKQKLVREINLFKVILQQKAFSALFYRFIAALVKHFKQKPIWLLTDRLNNAGDNGEAFFSYLNLKHKNEIKAIFVISKSSDDYQRVKKEGRVVDKESWIHKVYYLCCDVIISSDMLRNAFQPFGKDIEWYKDIVYRIPYVFLQHGITLHDVSRWLNRWNQNIAGFVTSGKAEYDAIVYGEYGYSPDKVWLTGFPRYDQLLTNPKQIITIMPTWRSYLEGAYDVKTGKRAILSGFHESEYCRFFHELLNNLELLETAQAHGYIIQFKAHPNMAGYEDLFEFNKDIQIVTSEKQYKEVFAESKLIITDYSSVSLILLIYENQSYMHNQAKKIFLVGLCHIKKATLIMSVMVLAL